MIPVAAVAISYFLLGMTLGVIAHGLLGFDVVYILLVVSLFVVFWILKEMHKYYD